MLFHSVFDYKDTVCLKVLTHLEAMCDSGKNIMIVCLNTSKLCRDETITNRCRSLVPRLLPAWT
jgi:hypothetical protein